jgi:hypothetical protein
VAILLVMFAFLLSFAAIGDILRCPPDEIRTLSPSAWLLVVILIPYFGVLAWVVAGKPRGEVSQDDEPLVVAPPRAQRQQRVLGPDDDPAFLAQLNDRIRRDDEEPEA